jgi:VanZ family protein
MVQDDTSRHIKQVGGLALAWLAVALLMFLAPSPREWGEFGHRISPFYDKIKSVFQPAVHVVLMASMALLCMHIFRRQAVLAASILSFGIVLVLAAVFEGLQSLLPSDFSRRADLADMIPSAAGAMMGCMSGLGARLFRTHKIPNADKRD